MFPSKFYTESAQIEKELKDKYSKMENNLEQKYLEMTKQLSSKEKEREIEYSTQLQALREKEEQLKYQ